MDLGKDLTYSLNSCGIEPELLVSPKGFLAIHKVVDFLNDAADRFDCPHFGFLVGKHQPPMRFGLMGQLPRFASNLSEAIEDALQFSILNSEFSLWEIKREHGFATAIRHNRVSFSSSLEQLQTLAVTVVFKALKNLCGEQWRASQIAFTHAAPEAKDQYDRFFGAPVNFNQDFNGIVFPEELLHLPLDTADPELHDILKNYLESVAIGYQPNDDISTKVHHRIKQNLGTNRCNLESIAQQLGLNLRTLQRELKKQGVTFRQLLTDVRREVAEHYLRSSTIALVELSDILGYRNVSAFSRAFKNARGLSPEQWKIDSKSM